MQITEQEQLLADPLKSPLTPVPLQPRLLRRNIATIKRIPPQKINERISLMSSKRQHWRFSASSNHETLLCSIIVSKIHGEPPMSKTGPPPTTSSSSNDLIFQDLKYMCQQNFAYQTDYHTFYDQLVQQKWNEITVNHILAAYGSSQFIFYASRYRIGDPDQIDLCPKKFLLIF